MADAPKITRRQLLGKSVRCAGAAAAAGLAAWLIGRRAQANTRPENMVWQLDPDKCIQCGNCAINCVLKSSAVKCVHAFAVCGYCDLCTGFLEAQPNQVNAGAENQLCPVGAIMRTFVEDPYYQYTIDQSLCVGCGKCVKGCAAFGNGSLFLQVIHGDMSFTEWLRSQGEDLFADAEDWREAVIGAERCSERLAELQDWINRLTARKPKDAAATRDANLPAGFRRDFGGSVDGIIITARKARDAGDLDKGKKDQMALGRLELFRDAAMNAKGRDVYFQKYRSQHSNVPRCLNCNECSIAIACPAQAFRRVPASQAYLLRKPKGPVA